MNNTSDAVTPPDTEVVQDPVGAENCVTLCDLRIFTGAQPQAAGRGPRRPGRVSEFMSDRAAADRFRARVEPYLREQ
jgi:hypothetical protein